MEIGHIRIVVCLENPESPNSRIVFKTRNNLLDLVLPAERMVYFGHEKSLRNCFEEIKRAFCSYFNKPAEAFHFEMFATDQTGTLSIAGVSRPGEHLDALAAYIATNIEVINHGGVHTPPM